MGFSWSSVVKGCLDRMRLSLAIWRVPPTNLDGELILQHIAAKTCNCPRHDFAGPATVSVVQTGTRCSRKGSVRPNRAGEGLLWILIGAQTRRDSLSQPHEQKRPERTWQTHLISKPPSALFRHEMV